MSADVFEISKDRIEVPAWLNVSVAVRATEKNRRMSIFVHDGAYYVQPTGQHPRSNSVELAIVDPKPVSARNEFEDLADMSVF